MSSEVSNVRSAQVVLPCVDLQATLAYFTGQLGFRIEAIHPADDPTVAVVSAYGVSLRLDRGARGAAGTLRLLCADPAALAGGITELVAPNGTRIELVAAEPRPELPPLQPSFALSRAGGGARWIEGRAGMRYRDLIPGRQGGRFIASHILIPEGGPVADYVHFHRVRFQMIYCARGWVRVVYEDQGPPFVLHEGDCALQPPGIRHRVLESSAGLEVIEVGSPAVHETLADHAMPLPTLTSQPHRDWGGQRFVRHEAASACWQPWRAGCFEARDLGIAEATRGLAGARVARARGGRETPASIHDAELAFFFVLKGEATLVCGARPGEAIAEGDAFVVPAGMHHALTGVSDSLELLEITLPGQG